MTQNDKEVELNMVRTYTKDVSFTFNPKVSTANPLVNINVNTAGNAINDNTQEVISLLSVTIKAEDAEEPFVKFDIVQAGIFTYKNLGDALDLALYFDGGAALWSYTTNRLDEFLLLNNLPPLMLQNQDYRVILRNTLLKQQEENKEIK